MSGLSSITKNATSGGEDIGLYLDGVSKYWGVSLLATAAAGAVSLVDTSNPLPISDAGGSITVDGTVGVSGSVAVTGTFWQATQPVSAAALPLPSGAATAAKQPALGTAGIASTDVLTVQGIASMTALKVDGSAVTQPVSGTFWQATQPVSLASVPSHAVTNAGTFAVQDSEKIADNAGFVDGTTKVLPVGLIYDEVAGTALTENDIGTPRMDAKRGAVAVIEDATKRGQRLAVGDTGAAAVNMAQVAGTTVDTNSGNKSAGTQRVVLATDQPNLTTPLNANVAQINGVTPLMGAGNTGTGSPRVTLASDDLMSAVVQAGTKTLSTSVTRPADTTAYAVNDVIANSTSSPTTGGFTFTSAGRVSGGGGVITDLLVTSSNNAATTLQGELWIFDQAATAVNDNAAWNLSDSEVLNVVAVIPFALIAEANNSWCHVQGLNIGYTCSGSANLRFLIKAKNAYTPANAEVLQFRLKVIQTN